MSTKTSSKLKVHGLIVRNIWPKQTIYAVLLGNSLDFETVNMYQICVLSTTLSAEEYLIWNMVKNVCAAPRESRVV